MCFSTPKPNAPAIAAPVTATRSTWRPWASMTLAGLVNMGLLLLCLSREPAVGRLAPRDGPLGQADSHLQRQVGTHRSLACVRLDRAQMSEPALFPCANRANDLDPLLGQAVREEQ